MLNKNRFDVCASTDCMCCDRQWGNRVCCLSSWIRWSRCLSAPRWKSLENRIGCLHDTIMYWLYTHISLSHITQWENKLTIHTNTCRLYCEYICARLLQDLCGKTHVRVTAVFPVHITASTPTNALWCDLTELTMSLRAWNPDKTGKTCSVLSAISASCDKKRIRFICFRIIGRFYLWKTRHFATNKYGNTGSCWVLQHHLGRKSLFIADESSDVAGWIFHLLL